MGLFALVLLGVLALAIPNSSTDCMMMGTRAICSSFNPGQVDPGMTILEVKTPVDLAALKPYKELRMIRCPRRNWCAFPVTGYCPCLSDPESGRSGGTPSPPAVDPTSSPNEPCPSTPRPENVRQLSLEFSMGACPLEPTVTVEAVIRDVLWSPVGPDATCWIPADSPIHREFGRRVEQLVDELLPRLPQERVAAVRRAVDASFDSLGMHCTVNWKDGELALLYFGGLGSGLFLWLVVTIVKLCLARFGRNKKLEESEDKSSTAGSIGSQTLSPSGGSSSGGLGSVPHPVYPFQPRLARFYDEASPCGKWLLRRLFPARKSDPGKAASGTGTSGTSPASSTGTSGQGIPLSVVISSGSRPSSIRSRSPTPQASSQRGTEDVQGGGGAAGYSPHSSPAAHPTTPMSGVNTSSQDEYRNLVQARRALDEQIYQAELQRRYEALMRAGEEASSSSRVASVVGSGGRPATPLSSPHQSGLGTPAPIDYGAVFNPLAPDYVRREFAAARETIRRADQELQEIMDLRAREGEAPSRAPSSGHGTSVPSTGSPSSPSSPRFPPLPVESPPASRSRSPLGDRRAPLSPRGLDRPRDIDLPAALGSRAMVRSFLYSDIEERSSSHDSNDHQWGGEPLSGPGQVEQGEPTLQAPPPPTARRHSTGGASAAFDPPPLQRAAGEEFGSRRSNRVSTAIKTAIADAGWQPAPRRKRRGPPPDESKPTSPKPSPPPAAGGRGRGRGAVGAQGAAQPAPGARPKEPAPSKKAKKGKK